MDNTRTQDTIPQLHRYAAPFQALPLDQTVHPFRIGDQVLVKKWKRDPLTPRWDGPHTVSLISQAAVKILGSDKWTHRTRIKRFLNPDQGTNPTEEDTGPLPAPAPEARGGMGEDTVWEYQGLDGLKGLFRKKPIMNSLLIFLFIGVYHGYGWENRFIQLGETIASSFNLSSCWVCGGPGDWNEWPWVAQPVPAKWWISNLSIVHKGTEVWDEDSSPW
ncbi:uncharacterized protein LOC128846944 [Malaclemys terrapin pileata]|uniref:uncharacterized protein LOC128846944 n=1 Tax=Malaclemys terrapin pileata TaxID=2991368 RepID=UPI0023A8BBD2|nr:uncharacterized protein LOC128846944 [Malaclemys terrapin pileata]